MARGPWMKKPGQKVVQTTPVNAPYGGSQGTLVTTQSSSSGPRKTRLVAVDPASVAASHGMRSASQPAPGPALPPGPPGPTPAPEVPVTRPKGPTLEKSPVGEETPRTPGEKPPDRGPSRPGLILGLGIGLIVVNAAFGNNAGSLLSGVWYKPDQQSPTTPVQNFFPIIGEVIFLVILVTIARFSKAAESLVLTFLIGLWLLWAMFRLPAAYKAGIPGLVGNLFSGTPQPSSNQADNTSQASSAPATSSQTKRLLALNQGGSFVGSVPHHSSILG